MMNRIKKWHIYVFLAVELIGAFGLGAGACINGPSSVSQVVAYLILATSFLGIILLFYKNKPSSNTNLLDLFLSIILISVNHGSLGLILGWTGCPYI